jgi:hypothetical protein
MNSSAPWVPKWSTAVRAEILAQPAVESGESVGRREAALEQQPHRIALEAEGGLQADEHIAEAGAEHVDRAAVGLVSAGRRAPLLLDLAQMRLAADMVIGRNAGVDIRVAAEALRIAQSTASRNASTSAGTSTSQPSAESRVSVA